MYNLDFSILLKDYKIILSGIYITVLISIVSAFLAFVLGTVFVYFRTSEIKFVNKITTFLISCIRNTPLLIIIYIFYNGLPSLNIVLPAIICGILALSFYTGAYISDALLSGVNTVPKEHSQASKALGLTRFQTFLFIIYPQALRNSVFILGSQFMNLIKNSSLVSFIAVADVFYVTYKEIAETYRIYEYFILAIIIYCSLTGFVLVVTNVLNKKFEMVGRKVRV